MKPRQFTRDDIPQHIQDRFWDRVDARSPEECWDWKLSLAEDGYGSFSVWSNGKIRTYKAHRVAYTLHHGDISGDNLVLHECDNRRCCNPYHLWEGTNDENMADMVAKGRCTRGDRHPHSKLTLEAAEEIRRTYVRHHPEFNQKYFARKYGVAVTTIGVLLRGKTWKSYDADHVL